MTFTSPLYTKQTIGRLLASPFISQAYSPSFMPMGIVNWGKMDTSLTWKIVYCENRRRTETNQHRRFNESAASRIPLWPADTPSAVRRSAASSHCTSRVPYPANPHRSPSARTGTDWSDRCRDPCTCSPL